MRLRLTEPFYVGLGVCAHNKDNVERAEFSNVELTASTSDPAARPVLYSALELAPVPGDRRVAYVAAERIDAPAWAPDGAFIYFSSDRTGVMQIWRMKPDGTQQEQVTSDAFSNWSPRISPDGRRIAVLSTDKTADQEVLLRVLSLSDKRVQSVVRLRGGGQGALDAPSWSPDSRRLVFVSHHLVTE
jgi:TolB protein